jgi:hypothetical protein
MLLKGGTTRNGMRMNMKRVQGQLFISPGFVLIAVLDSSVLICGENGLRFPGSEDARKAQRSCAGRF